MSAKRNEMFVMMEYFGYLRRDPDAAGYRVLAEQAEPVQRQLRAGGNGQGVHRLRRIPRALPLNRTTAAVFQIQVTVPCTNIGTVSTGSRRKLCSAKHAAKLLTLVLALLSILISSSKFEAQTGTLPGYLLDFCVGTN